MENYNFGDSWVLVILFILVFGMNGNGLGNRGDFSSFATASSQNEILLGQKFDALGQKVNAIGDGICSSTYALNNTIVNEGRNLSSQIAESTATNVAQTQKILDALATNRMADMQNQINALQLQNAMSGVVRYPSATTYNFGGNPFCGCSCNI